MRKTLVDGSRGRETKGRGRLFAVAVVLLALAVLLAACGESGPPPPSGSSKKSGAAAPNVDPATKAVMNSANEAVNNANRIASGEASKEEIEEMNRRAGAAAAANQAAAAGQDIRNDVNQDTQNRRTSDAAQKSINDADAAVRGTPNTMNPDITPVP